MLKRLVVAVVGLVGVVIIALGVASATLWRADDVLVADLQADEHIVVTDPGVLELAASEVTVRVEADGPVVLAVGRDTDVAGWVGTDAHQRVTGLSGWHELAAEDVAAPTPTAPEAPVEGEAPVDGDAAADGETPPDAVAPTVPDPTGSDMWIVEATGDGEAELTWTAQPGRWSLMAVSTGPTPPQLSLAWPQVVTTPWLWPCVVVGGLLVLLAAALLLRDVRRGRRGVEADWTPVLTGPLPAVGADGTPVQLTRRQLRELAAHGAVTDSGVRAPRDAPSIPDPVPDEPAYAGAAPASGVGQAAHTEAVAAVPTSAAGAPVAGGARADIGTGSRRALRALTSFGPSSRDEARADEAARPAAATQAAHARAGAGVPDRGPHESAAASHRDGTPRGWSPRGTGTDVPVPPVADPVRPGERTWPPGTPSTSTTGPGSSPRRAEPAAPPAARTASSGAPAPGERRDGGHPQGRPAWLGTAPSERGGGSPVLPPPGPASSTSRGPDGPARGSSARPGAAEHPAAQGTDRAVGAAPARSARPGWTPAAPAPGAVAGPASGPDARRPTPSQATGPTAGRDAGTAGGRTRPPSAPERPASDRAAHPDAPRPAWLRDSPVPGGPRAGTAATPEQAGGSRADAWRRAWGLAATDDDQTPQEER